jgi:hypothetical protein
MRRAIIAPPSKRSRPIIPYKFNVDEQWPAVMERLKIFFNTHACMKEDPKKWCLSVRGHILHYALTGRLAGCVYEADQVFHKLPAGNDVDSIKEELMLHGPVLTSFQPTDAVTAEYGLDTPSTVIILGWQQARGKGEVWLVRPTPQAEVVEIPVGSCSLIDEVQIPQQDSRNSAWQNPVTFPFLLRDFSGETDWMTLAEYDMTMSVDGFNALMQKLKTPGKDLDIFEMPTSKRQIEICPVGVKAMSRRAEIVGLVWKADSWTLRTKFVDA